MPNTTTIPLFLTAAVVGGGPAHGRAAWQPASTAGIVAAALAAEAAGAAILHLHVRDDMTGATTTEPVANAALLAVLRRAGCRAVLNLSAGDDGGRADHARRLALAEVGAEMVSLAAGSFNTGQRLYNNAPAFQKQQVTRLTAVRAVPEFEIFDAGQLAGMAALLAERVVPSHPAICLVFGVPGGMPADPTLLRWLAPRLPRDAVWCVSAQGDDADASEALLDTAIALGGHVRTGIEDSLWLRPGVPAPSSAAQVAFWAERGRTSGRTLGTAAQVREMLGITGTFQ